MQLIKTKIVFLFLLLNGLCSSLCWIAVMSKKQHLVMENSSNSLAGCIVMCFFVKFGALVNWFLNPHGESLHHCINSQSCNQVTKAKSQAFPEMPTWLQWLHPFPKKLDPKNYFFEVRDGLSKNVSMILVTCFIFKGRSKLPLRNVPHPSWCLNFL